MPSLNYALTVRALSIAEGWRTSEEAVMFINVQPAPRQHTSSNTINQPLTGDVHLSPFRVMEVSVSDNSAGGSKTGNTTAEISHTGSLEGAN